MLPISQYLSTLERLNFVQGSHKPINNISLQQANLQQHSHPLKSYQSSTHHCALHYLPNNSKLFPSSPHTPSLAERRGKHLDHLIPQVLQSIEQTQQSSGQKSARSLLSSLSPQLEKYNVKSYTRDKQYRRIITLDATGNVVQRKSPINYSHSLSPRETMTSSSDGSMASSYLGPVINMNGRSGSKNSNWPAHNGPASFSPSDWVEDKDLYLDFSLDEYHPNISVISPKKNITTRPSSRQEFLGNRSKLIMTSSPLSSNFDYLPSPKFRSRSRSRTQSLASLTKTTTLIKHDKAFIAKDPTLISKGTLEQSSRPALLDSRSFKSIDSPKTIPCVIKPLSRNQNSITGRFFPTINPKPKSAGATSNNDPNQLLDSSIHANTDTLSRKQRSYTISSTRLPSFSLESSHPGTSRPIIVKKIDSPLSSGNNQMTLRMTLTRPDLRADEAKIYAWQDSKFPYQNQYPADEFDEKFEGKGPFGGPDGWGIEEKQDSKVKKFWNRVTQNLKSPTG